MTGTPIPAAERYAALVALKAGLDDQIARAKAEALLEAARSNIRSWVTPYGPVNVTRTPAHVEINDAALLAWCEENRPDEVVITRSVRSSFREAMLRRVTRVGSNVVDTETGELVEWAYVAPPGDSTVVYPATTEQREAKRLARDLFAERATALTAGLRELTAEGEA